MENSTVNAVNLFVDGFKQWNENRNAASLVSVNKNEVLLLFGSHEFVFTCTDDEPFLVESRQRIFNWLDDVNLYCLEKRPTPSKLLNIMLKQIAKIKDLPKITKFSEPLNINRNLGFDLDKYNKNRELESLITSSKSTIVSSQKADQLFNRSVVGKIIITEFMKLWDTCRQNSRSPYKIDIVDNNIYKWTLTFSNFVNKELMESLTALNNKYGYNYIEVDILFHDILYPNYPPVIKIVRPRLENALMHKIANTKMIQLDYWCPTRNMTFIVNKLYQLLDKHAKICVNTDLNDRTAFINGAVMPVETHLLNLASFVDVGLNDDIDDENYDRMFCQKMVAKQKKTSKNPVWEPGTGYGHSGAAQWDISSYLQYLEERDKQAQTILYKITIEIRESTNLKEFYNTIQQSVLIKYIKSLLNDTPLLEIENI